MFLFDFGVFFEFILYFQLLILSCRCNPQTVSPFIRFLSEPLHKRNIIHAYVVMPFPVLVLFKRESRILVTKLSVEFRRIEITFQPYFLQLAQLLDYSFREFQGVSTEVNQRQQFLYMREVPLYLVHILVELGAFFSMWKSHATLTLLAKQDLPTFGYNMIDPLKSWCWGSILFYPFKISRFS